jgi:hypothetical protein
MALLTSGCPVTFRGDLKNQSAQEIFVLRPFEEKPYWQILPGESETIMWYTNCITIRSNDHTQYFSSFPFPDDVTSEGAFFGKVNGTFKNDKLYFINNSGALIEAKQNSTCGAPITIGSSRSLRSLGTG